MYTGYTCHLAKPGCGQSGGLPALSLGFAWPAQGTFLEAINHYLRVAFP